MTREKAAKFADYIAEYALYAVIFFIPISIALVEIFSGLAIFVFVVHQILCLGFALEKSSSCAILKNRAGQSRAMFALRNF